MRLPPAPLRTMDAVEPVPEQPLERALAPALALALVACGDASRAADSGRLDFVDVAPAAGIDVVVKSGDPRRWYIVESNGSGAAWLDHDADGDLDLFVANGSGLRYHDGGARLEVLGDGESRLYANVGGMRFRDVTREANALRTDWVNGVATGDVDNDGDPDLYLATFGRDAFLRNDGGRFADGTEEAGLGNPLWGAAAAFGDADLDGFLDLYVANYCRFDPAAPPLEGKRNTIDGVEVGWGPEEENGLGLNPGAPDVFYRNDGAGAFREATAASGLALEKPLCSYAAVFCDVDQDGLADLLVANDLQPANLFHNQSDDAGPRFVEEGVARGFAFGGNGEPTGAMGLATADFDGDGDLDVFRTNFDFEPNSLHVNDGSGQFHERAAAFGLAEPSVDRLGWGCGFFDADLDGDLDLLAANGHVYPQAEQIGMSGWAQESQLFEAVPAGDSLAYVDATARAGSGLAARHSSRGAAFGDPDDDGDVDVLLVDLDGPPRLLENRSERRGRWLGVQLVGTRSNRDGYGARVRVHAGGRTWTREAKTSDGLYSSNDPRLLFGLGPVEAVEHVEVRWPSGRLSRLEAPALDAYVTIREPAQEAHR